LIKIKSFLNPVYQDQKAV